MPAERAATVLASTFVANRSPIPDYGQEGYSVAWVDTADGRLQILVSGQRPAPGATGRIETQTLGDSAVEMFVEEPA
jgi:hypothetical protein